VISNRTRSFALNLLAKVGVTPPRDRPLYTYDQVFGNLMILDKYAQFVPFRPNRLQRHLMAHLTGRDVVIKSRQQGVSTFAVADQYARSVTETLRCASLAHDDQTTQKLRDMADRFHTRLPDSMHIPRGLDNDTTTTYPQTASEVTITTAGNPRGGRGGTYDYVHGSEVAFWADAGEIMAGLMQGVLLGRGRILLETTGNGAQGWCYNVVDAALNADDSTPSIWTIHFYEWWWTEEYALPLEPGEVLVYTPEEERLVRDHSLSPEQIKWRRAKIKEFRDSGEGDKFLQEYPEDITTCFLRSGFSVFGNFHHALYSAVGLEPDLSHFYVAGLDWGQASDYTCLCIMDATSNREVVLARWRRMSWEAMHLEILKLCKKWNVKLILPEKNSASTNVEALANGLQREGLKTSVWPVDMSNPLKADLVSEFRYALEAEDFKLLKIDFGTRELSAFESRQNASGIYVYNAPKKKGQDDEDKPHDDTVIARLLARRAMLMRGYTGSPDWLNERV